MKRLICALLLLAASSAWASPQLLFLAATRSGGGDPIIEDGSSGWAKSEGGTGSALMSTTYPGGIEPGSYHVTRTKTLNLRAGTITISGTASTYDETYTTYGGIILYIDDVQVAGGDETAPVVYNNADTGSHTVKIEIYAGRDTEDSHDVSASVTSVSIPVTP